MGRFDSGPPLMKTEDIRAELQGLAKIIGGLETDLAAARKDRARLVGAANADPAISMTEAAKLAGISRVAAYEVLKS